MNSLIYPIRFISCKRVSASKGERLTRNFLYNHCFLCAPSNIVTQNCILPQIVQNFTTSTPALIVFNFEDDKRPKKVRTNDISTRNFHSGFVLFNEPGKPSSKVEETVQAIKEAKEESEQKAQQLTSTAVAQKPVVKKSLKQKIIDECLHYYHGFRLLFIDINISRKLAWRILQGKPLTRREQKLLVRTVGDMFRLVPFSVFIIVPFLEFALPFFIKMFPGMLPSTFQTATEREDKIKRDVKVKLEMAKFLQRTLDELPVGSKGGHSSQLAKEFGLFFQKVRTSGEMTSTEEIMKFSKLFADEITLDSMPRPQLMALCRVLEINPIGPTNVLRFQLRLKLRSLHADDLMIEKEGLESLSQAELQAACRARGMPALGVPEERLRSQLTQWLDLSIRKKVPPSLLLLSQAFMLPDTVPTSQKLAQTISALPDAVGTRTKAVIGEREGKVDHKTKIEIIKEEMKAIKEEKKELLEEAEKVEREKIRKEEEEIRDTAPIIQDTAPMFPELRAALANLKNTPISLGGENEISAKDIQILDTALDLLGKHKNDLMVEKEELEELRQEMSEYQEDIADLKKVTTETGTAHSVSETKAAKRLFKKVDKMIAKVDHTLLELGKNKDRYDELDIKTELENKASNGVIRLDELLAVLNKMELDKGRIETITQVLDKIDTDKDGEIRLESVLKIIELVGTDNVPLSQNQLGEIINIVSKEEALEMDEQIAKALENEPQEKPSDQTSEECKRGQKASAQQVPVSENTAIAESSGKSPVSEPEKPGGMKL